MDEAENSVGDEHFLLPPKSIAEEEWPSGIYPRRLCAG